jgi:hypothetical protein
VQLAHVAPAPPADHIPGTHATHVEDEEVRAVPGLQGRGSLQIDSEVVLPLGVKVVDGHVAVQRVCVDAEANDRGGYVSPVSEAEDARYILRI